MVNTRNASLTPAVTMESLQETMAALQEAMNNMMTQQQLVNAELEALKNDEGTREVVKRFGAVYEDPILDLKNLRQEGYVQQYQEAFETLLNRVKLNKAYDVSLFIKGLKKEVSIPIRMFKISNLTDVYAMAKMMQARKMMMIVANLAWIQAKEVMYGLRHRCGSTCR
nr:reverse transcriptase [Tanacetum cinerariifolium]